MDVPGEVLDGFVTGDRDEERPLQESTYSDVNANGCTR